MNDTKKAHILENLNSLTLLTSNVRRLFIYMDAFGLLPLAERQVLLSFPDNGSRVRGMYTVLLQKDTDNYFNLIKCLHLSKNKEAARLLEEIYPSVTNSGARSSFFLDEDFQVHPKHVARIVEILEYFPISQRDWENITLDLVRRNCDDLLNLTTPSAALKMMTTLDAWLESSGKSATFSILLSTIGRTHKAAAEHLQGELDEILGVE